VVGTASFKSSGVSPLPPPPEPKGGQHLLAGEGAGEPIPTNGEKAWHSVYSVVLFLSTCYRLGSSNL
jgi:hypothetical protein